VAQAVAAGTPVIVTEQYGIGPLLADEAATLSRAMERLLVEPDLRSRLTAGCAAVTYRTGWMNL